MATEADIWHSKRQSEIFSGIVIESKQLLVISMNTLTARFPAVRLSLMPLVIAAPAPNGRRLFIPSHTDPIYLLCCTCDGWLVAPS